MTRLTLFTRPGCHLCDAMKGVVAELGAAFRVTLEEVDISADPRLERRYGAEIPVLAHGETVVARVRTTRAALETALDALPRR